MRIFFYGDKEWASEQYECEICGCHGDDMFYDKDGRLLCSNCIFEEESMAGWND